MSIIVSKIFYKFCNDGIIHERTPSYLPQSNEVAERKNCTFVVLVNGMLDTTGLSKALLFHVITQIEFRARIKRKSLMKSGLKENHHLLIYAVGDSWRKSTFQTMRNASSDQI